MSDETPDTGVDEPADQPDEALPDPTAPDEIAAPARRPTPGASAASRARRIGGRPMPGPRTGAEVGDAPAPKPTASATKPPKTQKTPKPAKPSKPARPARPADAAALQRRLDRLRWIPACIAALAVLAALGIGAWLSDGVWWGNKIQNNRTQQSQQVLAAAKSCAVALLSFDYRNLDESQHKGDQCATGDYRTQYDQTFNTIVRKIAPQRHATQSLQIANGGVQAISSDGQQWVILLFGQQTYADNTQTSGTPRLDVATFAVTMTKINGAWLVTKMDPTG